MTKNSVNKGSQLKQKSKDKTSSIEESRASKKLIKK